MGKVGEGKINLFIKEKRKSNYRKCMYDMTSLREWGKIYLSNLGNE